jgi:SAM-dependent methyltransferase
MNIEKSYAGLPWLFKYWSMLIENQLRLVEIHDSNIKNMKILIISPPTDRGITLLTQANANGESYLLCFSALIEKIAQRNSQKQRITGLKTCTSEFFGIPFADAHFDVIFTNCFFDFCSELDFDKIIKEIKRALNSQGLFFSIYMDFPSRLGEKVWFRFFKIFPSLSQGCHPVDIKPGLKRANFSLKKDVSMRRFCFPMKYLIAEKF